MAAAKTFFCIDAHTCGNPVRVVAGGGPTLEGKNMSEKRQHFLREYDWIRKGLMFEPRGHDMMSGSILYPPVDPANDVGVLFIETSGCLPMCGHGTISTVTIAIEHGLVVPKTPGILNLEAVAYTHLYVYKRQYVINLKVGNKVKVTFPDINRVVDTKVTFVGKTINQLSRTFPVEVSLPTYSDLRPNMTSILQVIFETVPDALTVPVNVVQDINNQKVVYIAEANGTQTVARRKVVQVKGIYGTQAHITGLKAGDKIITVGYQGLNDGEVVKF